MSFDGTGPTDFRASSTTSADPPETIVYDRVNGSVIRYTIRGACTLSVRRSSAVSDAASAGIRDAY